MPHLAHLRTTKLAASGIALLVGWSPAVSMGEETDIAVSPAVNVLIDESNPPAAPAETRRQEKRTNQPSTEAEIS
jgi:hypothetical protein